MIALNDESNMTSLMGYAISLLFDSTREDNLTRMKRDATQLPPRKD